MTYRPLNLVRRGWYSLLMSGSFASLIFGMDLTPTAATSTVTSPTVATSTEAAPMESTSSVLPSSVSASQEAAPPQEEPTTGFSATRLTPTEDLIFGTTVEDPYRWL